MRFTIANLLTVSRIFIAPIVLAFMIADSPSMMTVAVVLFVIGALTDWFDGYLARKYGEETDLGKFLDPLADKVFTSTAFIAFYLVGVMPLWMVIVIVLRDVGTTVMRVVADEKGQPLVTSWHAKVKTFSQMDFISCTLSLMWLGKTLPETFVGIQANKFLYSVPMYAVMLGVTAFTIWTGMEYVMRKGNSESGKGKVI